MAWKMLLDVSRRDENSWRKHSQTLGGSLRRQLEVSPNGLVFREMLAEQVGLIKSIPLEQAERVSKLVQSNLPAGTRSTELAKTILGENDIPAWRAKLIARTEVSRAQSTLTQVRARAVGSEGYIWRTVGDSDVRPEHKKMEGKFVRWDNPPSFPTEPTLGAYHAGCAPNCRCYAEPVLPDY